MKAADSIGPSLLFSLSAVFLDRDGVLIKTNVHGGRALAVGAADEIVILDGVQEACATLSANGLFLVMVTNQPDVARGVTPRHFVEDTNRYLADALGLDAVKVCYHDDSDRCNCRKPQCGMLTTAATEHGIDLHRSVMIGDRWRDVEAGRRAGCRTVLIGNGYDEKVPVEADYNAASLPDAVSWVLTAISNIEKN